MLHRVRTPAAVALTAASLSAPWVIPSAAGSGSVPEPAPPAVARAEVASSRISLDGPRPQRLTITAPDAGARQVRVALVGGGAQEPVREWKLGPATAAERRTVTWDARLGGDDRPAPEGRYRFLVAVDDGPVTTAGEIFEVVRAFFPVRGPHSYADGMGAGRGHQGQDLLAPCGTPVVAARGGRVGETGTDGVRGNYVVVDTPGGGSMAYLHLLSAPEVAPGDEVVTGQELGIVGSTGHSTACHLHFELWSAPGYWRGRPLDPTRALRRWDAATGAGRERR